MNAIEPSGPRVEHRPIAPVLRTLVLVDLADSTALVGRLGDRQAAELFRRHDRVVRTLLNTHAGREIDKTDGFLAMFERPIQAVAFALDYQRQLRQLGDEERCALAARVGIHIGDVLVWDNAQEDVAKGAKATEVEGLAKPIASRLMQLALPGQILLSSITHSLAHRAQGELGERLALVRWCAHGRYRFKGVPDPIPVFEVGEEGLAPLRTPPWSGKAHREVPLWRRPAVLALEFALLFSAVAVPVWYLLQPAPAIAFANRDWIVVGDFKNLTGESRFDESLQTAFRLGLEQSRYVNVLSDLKARETIKLMQRAPEKTVIDRAVGSEIAIRDGARALVLPTVAEVGGRVRVTAEIIDPHTQATVYSESADGIGEDSVLLSLDKVGQQLRTRLGEALTKVSSESKPLEKVATGDVDALRSYSLGIDRYGKGRFGEALSFFDHAVKLDPDFALAYVGKASVLFSTDREPEAVQILQRTARLDDRLSVRDALYVNAWQATFGPTEPALDQWRTLAALYPDFFKGVGAYAFFAWQRANRYADAIEAAEQAASPKNPNRATSDYLLGILYLGQDRYKDAASSFERYVGPNGEPGGEFHSMLKAAQRDFPGATAMLERSRSADDKPTGAATTVTEAAMLVDQGLKEQASRKIDVAIQDAEKTSSRKLRQLKTVRLSLDSLFDSGHLRKNLLDFLAEEKKAFSSEDAYLRAETAFRIHFAAYLAAHIGELDVARNASSAISMTPGYVIVEQMKSIARAEYLRKQGKKTEAVKELLSLIDGNELFLAHVVLLNAYEDMGDYAKARAEAAWLTSHRGRAYVEFGVEQMLLPFNVAQSDIAHLRAAELALKSDDMPELSRHLSEFRAAWPNPESLGGIAARVSSLEKTIADKK